MQERYSVSDSPPEHSWENENGNPGDLTLKPTVPWISTLKEETFIIYYIFTPYFFFKKKTPAENKQK